MAALHDLLYGMRGVVFPFGGTAAPAGFLMCDGQAVSRTTYAALFSVIGTTFGAGDGATTFNVPDLRGEFIRGADRGRGVDAGRTLGSNQRGTIVPIDGTGSAGGASPNSGYVPVSTSTLLGVSNIDTVASRVGVDVSNRAAYPDTIEVYMGSPTLADSTAFTPGTARPRNVAMNYVIKT